MGGSGSGNWYRWNSKATTESQHRVDLRYLKKHNLLNPGNFRTLSWTQNERQTGYINFRAEKNRLILSYLYRLQGGEWEDVEEVVNFDWTPCNYGGERIWLLCPRCLRRVLVLYGAGKYFLCRHCHGLTYSTQQENALDRLIRKERKVRKGLGGSEDLFEPFPGKPKRMHWKTYERLRFEAKRARVLYHSIFFRKFGISL